MSSVFPKATPVIGDNPYGIPDLLGLNIGQIEMAHYGATKKMMTVVESQAILISTNTGRLETLNSAISTTLGNLGYSGNV